MGPGSRAGARVVCITAKCKMPPPLLRMPIVTREASDAFAASVLIAAWSPALSLPALGPPTMDPTPALELFTSLDDPRPVAALHFMGGFLHKLWLSLALWDLLSKATIEGAAGRRNSRGLVEEHRHDDTTENQCEPKQWVVKGEVSL